MDGERNAQEVLGVECATGGERLVVPSSAIDQIVEVEVAPLPLAPPFVLGLAVRGDELVLTVSAGRHVAATSRGVTKAVLLTNTGMPMRVAVAIDEVISFVKASVRGDEGRSWKRRATSSDGREVAWVDVERLGLALRAAGDSQ